MAAFPPRGTGHPWKEALWLPVESRRGAANPTRATQGVREGGQMKPLGSMDGKHMKYWQGHLFPGGLGSFKPIPNDYKDNLKKGGTDVATIPGEVSGSSLCITLNKLLKIMLLLFKGILTIDHQKAPNGPLIKIQREYA